MLKLTWNRYAMLMVMKELLVNANFDIIDYSRQNVSALFMKLLLDKKKKIYAFQIREFSYYSKKTKKQKNKKKTIAFFHYTVKSFCLEFSE